MCKSQHFDEVINAVAQLIEVLNDVFEGLR